MNLYLMSLITLYSLHHGIDPRLSLSVAYQETGIREITRLNDGKSTSFGSMQVKRIVAKDLGLPETIVETPEGNILVGVLFLEKKLKQCKGDIKKALGAYNSGKGCVATKYSDSVMNNFKRF